MRLLRRKDLGPLKGIWYSPTHLRRISDPNSKWYQGFPQPVRMGSRRGYVESEIDAWIASRPRLKPTTTLQEEEQFELPLGKLPNPAGGEAPDYSNHNIED
jgi:predicted DNA-binding transcriptional regulator AlpA